LLWTSMDARRRSNSAISPKYPPHQDNHGLRWMMIMGTENPRVGGSIPSLATTKSSDDVQARAKATDW
jgi:hypothetical protein